MRNGKQGFKLAIDRETKRVVHIDQVSEGFTDAICDVCGESLVASNYMRGGNRKVDTYFKHRHDTGCGIETTIHKWAKQIIADEMRVRFPELVEKADATDSRDDYHVFRETLSSSIIKLNECAQEVSLTSNEEERRPDLYGIMADGEPVAIEIFVTHNVDEKKAPFFRSAALDCIEVDLSSITENELKDAETFKSIVVDTAPRKWIFARKSQELKEKAKARLNSKLAAVEARYEAEAQSEKEANSRKRKELAEVKKCWRADNADFLALVTGYLDVGNREKLMAIQTERMKHGHQSPNKFINGSYELYRWLLDTFGKIPDIIDKPVPGELGFDCYRTIWQWEVYRRVVLFSFNAIQTTLRENARTLGSDTADFWDAFAVSFSIDDIYDALRNIPLRKLCRESIILENGPIKTEQKVESHLGLKTKEWRELPKPVCVIRRYVRLLVNEGYAKQGSGDIYYASQDAPVSEHLKYVRVSFV